jgi:hypothetical protein
MNSFGQRDSRYENIKLGDSPYTIAQSGCFISVISRILNLSLDTVNKMILEGGGFAKDKDGYADLVDWNKLSQIFTGIIISYKSPYNNPDVLENLAKGNSIIAVVDSKPIGGTGIHAVQYLGGHQLYDPWEDKIKQTSDFGVPYSYVIVSGKYQSVKPEIPAQPVTNMIVASDVFMRLVTKSTNLDNLLTALGYLPDLGSQADSYKTILAGIQSLITVEVDKRAPITTTVTPPNTQQGVEVPTTQAKSIWETDVMELLKSIFKNTKGVSK